MSVVIRGMDMPKSCLVCLCCDKNTDNCLLQSDEQNELSETWEDQKSKCPLISITRCKDCWAYETAEYDDGYKKQFCHLFKRQMQEDDFCSYGEPCDCFEKHSIAKIDRKE